MGVNSVKQGVVTLDNSVGGGSGGSQFYNLYIDGHVRLKNGTVFENSQVPHARHVGSWIEGQRDLWVRSAEHGDQVVGWAAPEHMAAKAEADELYTARCWCCAYAVGAAVCCPCVVCQAVAQ